MIKIRVNIHSKVTAKKLLLDGIPGYAQLVVEHGLGQRFATRQQPAYKTRQAAVQKLHQFFNADVFDDTLFLTPCQQLYHGCKRANPCFPRGFHNDGGVVKLIHKPEMQRIIHEVAH